MKLSVVIPTLDRHDSLARLLKSIAAQDRPADEVIIVTGAADGAEIEGCAALAELTAVEVSVIETAASVCIQRNAGIRAASGTHVCLADDDIELPPDYFSTALEYIREANAGAVSGLVVQPDENGIWRAEYPPASLRQLAWRLLFQQGIWGGVNTIAMPSIGLDADTPRSASVRNVGQRWKNAVGRAILKFYRRRGNTYTAAGWPLITNFSDTVVRTTIYGLGAAVVRRDWLVNSPYDEVLDAHGIGDNYGVALGFPGCCPIHLLTELKALHYRESVHRLDARRAHGRRVLALDYFLKSNARFTAFNRLILRWSMLGFLTGSLSQRDWPATRMNLALLARLCLCRNPYAIGAAKGRKKLEVC